MKILFIVPYPTEGASNRYRIEQYLPYFKKNGINFNLRPFWTSPAFAVLFKKGHYFKKIYFFILGTFFRILDLLRIFQYDMVFIHRETYPLGGAFFETILCQLKKPFIYDFDDAIFLFFSSRPNNFIEKFKKPDKVVNIIRMSRHVIAGNCYLAEFALRYTPSVSIIPTSIDTDKYYPVDNKHCNEVIIGWIGSITTLDFLNMMKNVFASLSSRFSYIKFKIVGGDFFINNLTNIISKPWSLKEELNDLRSFDIGIMPMPDNEWTKGKCGFKAILYMSMGMPCVCSPVGVNKEIITDGVNGFLANTEEEWISKLSFLIENAQLRHKIGLLGRKTIEGRYSINTNAPKILEILRNVYTERYRR